MSLEQYYLGCLSQASYLIGDETTHTAAVIDPRRDVDEYVPLPQLKDRLAELPGEGPLVVYCRTGERSSMAASLLEAAGRTGVLDLVGGITAWNATAQKT